MYPTWQPTEFDEPADQQVGQVAREEQVLVGRRPDLGLVGSHPVGFRFGLQVGDGLGGAGHGKGCAPQSAERFEPLGAALVEPDDGRAQRLSVPADIDQRAAL